MFRPLGAVVFGHFGDRLGRKKTLVTTLLMMGGGTFAIGLVPTAAVIGAGAPLILVLLRAIRGTALGGEWAGAALLTSEYADAKKRGKYSLFPQLGPGLGVIIASGTFLLTIKMFGLAAFRGMGPARPVPRQHRADRARPVGSAEHRRDPVFHEGDRGRQSDRLSLRRGPARAVEAGPPRRRHAVDELRGRSTSRSFSSAASPRSPPRPVARASPRTSCSRATWSPASPCASP
ncbi:MFS transporter [Nocardioides sp. B-3]|uniref:MFS transporter n=1 Tax=Nocardioides sp. B-3 TaxID=2895565 RepID=UPI002153925D|nr:MFS transporter [Nocardioides sp. B-3]UUZ61134.1 MFS transporter [Nocardioides sp. B-3]